MSHSPIHSCCPLDCPDSCVLEVSPGAGNGTRGTAPVPRLGGRADHPVTAGFICSKVAGFGRRLDHPDRLLTPARRIGPKGSGEFEPVSWDEALDEIARRLGEVARSSGPEAILPYHYGGSNGLLTEGWLDALFFARLGASRIAKTLCAAPSTAVAGGLYGAMPGVAYEDYPEARLIVLWGVNPRVSHIHLAPWLEAAKKRGAKVVSVDPVRGGSRDTFDLHLAPLPGTDLPLALGMIHRLRELDALDRDFLAAHLRDADNAGPLLEAAAAWPLERAAAEAGVPADDLERLTRWYAETRPAVIRTGWGLERNSNGGRAMAAVLALPALVGHFGVPGGGYTMSNSKVIACDREALLGISEGREGGSRTARSAPRTLNMSQLGRQLAPGADLDPPVEALFVYNANPVATTPDQNAVLAGLAREDLFTVVFEQVMTDTARWADMLLPATTFLEHWDLVKSYGTYTLGVVRPAVERRGQARPNPEVFADLARRIGMDDEAFSWGEEESLRRVASATTLNGRPVDVERLLSHGYVRVEFPDHPSQNGHRGPGRPVQMGNVGPLTADGKIDLAPPVLGPDPYLYRPAAPEYPLALISPASAKRVTSTLGELQDEVRVTLHPDDAAARDIGPGDLVRVWNDLGEVVIEAEVSERVRPRVAVLPKGFWGRASKNGAAGTALVPDEVNDVAGGAVYNDARVEIGKIGTGGA